MYMTQGMPQTQKGGHLLISFPSSRCLSKVNQQLTSSSHGWQHYLPYPVKPYWLSALWLLRASPTCTAASSHNPSTNVHFDSNHDASMADNTLHHHRSHQCHQQLTHKLCTAAFHIGVVMDCATPTIASSWNNHPCNHTAICVTANNVPTVTEATLTMTMYCPNESTPSALLCPQSPQSFPVSPGNF